MNRNYAETEKQVRAALQADNLLAFHADTVFEVLETLGEGGMGKVLAVRDRRIGRRAALKLLSAEAGDLDAEARFLREAEMTTQLDHPGVPPIYEIGRSPRGELFMLMRLIEGQTLSAEIKHAHARGFSRADQRALLSALARIAETLAYAHGHGILHRDIKPANIMIGRFGEVLLMDWGVAKDLNRSAPSHSALIAAVDDKLLSNLNIKHLQSEGLTLSGAAVGTPGYMAPEQAAGEDLDERADVFALGLLIAEIWRGKPLIQGKGLFALMKANMDCEFPTPEEWDSPPPEPLAWIIEQALQSDREERTDNALLFKDQIESWLLGEPIPGRATDSREKMTYWARSHPTRLLSLTFSLIFLVGLVLFAFSLRELKQRTLALAGEVQLKTQAQDDARRAEKVLHLLNEARENVSKSQFSKIDGLLKGALLASDRSEAVLLAAAKIYSDCGQREPAKALLTEASQRFQPAYAALLELGIIESEGHVNFSSAFIELSRRAKERAEDNEWTTMCDSLASLESGNLENALASIERCLQQNPSQALAYLIRANINLNTLNLQAARRDTHKTLSLNKNSAAALVTRAEIHRLEKNFDAAASDLFEVARIYPNYASLYFARANLARDRGDLDGELANLNAAIARQPTEPRAIFNRALALSKRGDRMGAMQDYDRALHLAPKMIEALVNRGHLSLELGEILKARNDAAKALELRPTFAKALFLNALIQMHEGNDQAADKSFELALEQDPRHAPSIINRAIIKMKKSDYQSALEDLNQAIVIEPRLVEGWTTRSQIYWTLGQREKALADSDEAIRLSPKDADLYFNRAQLLKVLREFIPALEDLGVARSLKPRDTAIIEERVTVLQALGRRTAAIKEAEYLLKLKPDHPKAESIRSWIEKNSPSKPGH